jgi:Tannase and feruloyl esterase
MPFPIATAQVALNFQNPRLASPFFRNASGNGSDGWKSLTYSDLARAHDAGLALQPKFANIDSDNPDLRRFRDHKGKLIYYYGMADQLIPIQGSLNYFARVAQKMGGYKTIQKFYRFYPIPGMGHCFGPGSVNGIAGVSPPVDPPLPAPHQLFTALIDWVENGQSPTHFVIKNSNASIARPLCSYPDKLKYVAGDRAVATSYQCR